MRQASETVAYYQVIQLTIPKLTAWHREHAHLAMPEGEVFNYYQGVPWEIPDDDPPLYTKMLSSGFWIEKAAETFLGESKTDTTHPYHRLHHYLDRFWREYVSAYRSDELHRTGTSEDAEWNDTENHTYEPLIVGTSKGIVRQGADLIAAGAVHCMEYDNENKSANLMSNIVKKLPQMRWIATMVRDSGRRRAEIDGLIPLPVPTNTSKLLVVQLTRAGSRQELIAPFKKYRVLAHEKFIPSEIISDGPPPKSGTCSGDVNVAMDNSAHRRNTAEFYAEMGLPQLGHSSTFNSGIFSLALGKRLAETTFLPKLAAFMSEQ